MDEIRYDEKLERPERVIKVTAAVPNGIQGLWTTDNEANVKWRENGPRLDALRKLGSGDEDDAGAGPWRLSQDTWKISQFGLFLHPLPPSDSGVSIVSIEC